MRALLATSTEGPEGLEVGDAADLDDALVAEAADRVLIDVRAAGLTFPDVLLSQGAYQLRPAWPFSPGLEVAGTVRAASSQSGFAVGDRVTALMNYGGLAEQALADAHMTAPMPATLGYGEAAASVVNYRTAVYALRYRAALTAGETCLVHGAGGGLGLATVQVAAAMGARVIAVASDAAKAQIAREAGADVVVAAGSWEQDVRDTVAGGPDVILDPVGGDRFAASVKLLDDHGRIVILGFAEGSIPTIAANRVLFRNVSVIGAALGAFVSRHPERAREIADAVNELVVERGLRPLVAREVPLDGAAAALGDIANRRAAGKTVVDMSLPPCPG